MAACAAYLFAAILTARTGVLPQVPIYDGLAPPAPYRYVSPPPDLADENEPPARAVGTLELEAEGSRARTVATADGQMLVVFPDGAVRARGGEDTVDVKITPVDPGRLSTPPEGLRFSGNAYRVEARYMKSRATVELASPATMVLRYATHASVVLRLDGRAWRRIETESAQASLQLFAESTELGAFAAAGVPERSRAWIAYAAAAAGVVAGAVGYVSGRRRSRRPKGRGSVRRRRPGRT
jgi:hypothetical protein